MTSGNEFQNLIEKVNDISKENSTLEIIQLNDRRYTNPKSQEGHDSDGTQSSNAQSEKLHKIVLRLGSRNRKVFHRGLVGTDK